MMRQPNNAGERNRLELHPYLNKKTQLEQGRMETKGFDPVSIHLDP
jgi:hypothetical protein